MQDISAAAAVFMWRAVLIAPLLAFMVFFTIRKISNLIQLSVSLLLISILCFSFILYLFEFRFTNAWDNIFWLAASYFFYSLLVALSLQLKIKPVRYFVFTVATLPICLGYILGISKAGLLGLFFIVGDMVSPPEQTKEMETGLVCELTLTGLAGSSDYSIDLYESWPKVPFIRRRVAHLSVDPGDVSSADKTCADALKTFRH